MSFSNFKCEMLDKSSKMISLKSMSKLEHNIYIRVFYKRCINEKKNINYLDSNF